MGIPGLICYNSSANSSCATDWRSTNASCYYVSTDVMTWHAAARACKRLGAHLVTIETEEEQYQIRGKSTCACFTFRKCLNFI